MVGLAAACTIKNENHCYYNDASDGCLAQDPTKPYCSQCTNDNDGCVADMPNAACYVGGGSETTTTATSSSEASTTIAASESTSMTTTSTSSESSTSTQPPETTSSSGGESPCGNGVLEAPEQCDGDAFGEATCASLGYDGGTLSCTPSCFFDPSTCAAPGTCANEMLDMDEECDGNLFTVRTCAELSSVYGGGVLGCNPNCTYNTDECCVADGQLCNGATNCCSENCLLALCNPL